MGTNRDCNPAQILKDIRSIYFPLPLYYQVKIIPFLPSLISIPKKSWQIHVYFQTLNASKPSSLFSKTTLSLLLSSTHPSVHSLAAQPSSFSQFPSSYFANPTFFTSSDSSLPFLYFFVSPSLSVSPPRSYHLPFQS